MPSPRRYTTAGAFRRALEERLKRASMADQVDLNRLRLADPVSRPGGGMWAPDRRGRGVCGGTEVLRRSAGTERRAVNVV
jgi:hypothetical protein